MKENIRHLLLTICFSLSLFLIHAQELTVNSPDKQLSVTLSISNGKVFYSVTYANKSMLENSPLGLITNEGDLSSTLTYIGRKDSLINKKYNADRIKKSQIHYVANQTIYKFENAKRFKMNIVFQVSNNDIAFRYELDTMGQRLVCVVEKEITGYKFSAATTTFLSPMMTSMTGYARSAPSYESGYRADAAMNDTTLRPDGFVLPGLFHIGENGWVLLSETGVSSLYCGSHLSSYSKETGAYSIQYPNPAQNNGFGSTGAALSLPGNTPWRTITVSNTLKPIVETTIPLMLSIHSTLHPANINLGKQHGAGLSGRTPV